MLFSSSAKLQVVLGAAVTTNPVTVVASWADIAANASTLAPDSATTSVSTTSPVDVIGSPSAGQRQVKFVTIFNDDTVGHAVTVRLSDSTNLRKLLSVDVEAGGRIEFTPNGWRVFDATGAEVGSGGGGGGGGGSTDWSDLTGVPAKVTAVADGDGAVPPVGYGVYAVSTDDTLVQDDCTYLRSGVLAMPADYPLAPAGYASSYTTFPPYSVFTGVSLAGKSAQACLAVAGGFLFFAPNAVYKVDSSNNVTTVSTASGTWAWPCRVSSSIIICFAASSQTTYIYSTDDGATWSTATTPGGFSDTYRPMTNGTVTAVTRNSSTSTAYYTTDGVTWNTSTMPSAQIWTNCAYGGGIFFASAAASTGATAISTDGITWTSATARPSIGTASSGVYMYGKFRVCASTGAAETADGVTWTTATQPSASTLRFYVDNSTAAVLANSPTAQYITRDGIVWQTLSGGYSGGNVNIAGLNGVVYNTNVTPLVVLPLFPVVGAGTSLYLRVA